MCTITAVLLVSSCTFLSLAYLHFAGELGHHTEAAAGWGLLTLGLLTLPPGAYGAYLVCLVLLGGESWESIPF